MKRAIMLFLTILSVASLFSCDAINQALQNDSSNVEISTDLLNLLPANADS